VKVVIPSRRRSDTIREHTLSVFPDAYVLVDEIEADDYEPVVKSGRLLTHPSLTPLGPIQNWIIDNVSDPEGVAIVDDDTISSWCMVGWSPRRLDPKSTMVALRNAAQCAQDAGCGLFGWAANPNPIIYEPTRPLKLSRWLGKPLGFAPGHGLRFDERLTLMEDVDLCLQSLQKHRIIWCDARFATAGVALTNSGGSAHLRSDEAFARERAILKEKWGPYIDFNTEAGHFSKRYAQGLPATTLQTYVYVPRTQQGF
jgi:hypothetical protein